MLTDGIDAGWTYALCFVRGSVAKFQSHCMMLVLALLKAAWSVGPWVCIGCGTRDVSRGTGMYVASSDTLAVGSATSAIRTNGRVRFGNVASS